MKNKVVILCIFMFFATFITGCTNEAVNTDFNSGHSALPSNEVIDEDPVPIRLFDPIATLGLDFSEHYAGFRELIKENFNIDLSISIDGSGMDYYEQVQQSDIFLCKLQGLHGERRWMVDNNVIIPFSDYLQDNQTWLSLPEGFRNAFADADGRIWAIPFSDTPQIWARSIRKDWLANTKLSVPSTVNELYNMMQAFTYNDPDGNGLDDTFGSGLSDRLIRCFNFKDVFEANGCYMSYGCSWLDEKEVVINNTMAGYNPETGRVEDLLYNPAFLQSLEMIESMLDNGLVDLKPDTFSDGNLSNPNVGSHMGLIKNNIIYPDYYEYCYSLEGLKDEATATVLYGDRMVYYLTSNVNNPEKAVPAFIEMMYRDIESYKLMRYGILGEDNLYSAKNGILYRNDVNENITSHLQLTGNLSWLSKELFTDETLKDGAQYMNIEEVMSDDNMMPMSHIQMALVENTTEILKMNPDGSYPDGPEYYYHDLVYTFKSFFERELSAEDLYYRIEKLHMKYGMAEWIEEINQRWLGVD